ncbi:hypothetical protein HMPREF1212_04435 [Parabacteroides sp. HGS0025]|uniref:RagB/SusD family nutrient uptake outer membrane protein n=1 Tax=Parabacteroides sp. HGS0025 TaxID=1078087 RepID=UPI0006175E55|nr:RagB/SusD family nutrient uptake outer membrane protein [Parabacteroides sp. HGS0025]KKB46938.1 hypothetical protein HMPREF1212_04435 [Parabacteroides sp. HGS0025]
MTIKYLLYGSLLAMSVSCSDILNKKDLSAVTDDQVWGDAKYATAYLNRLYEKNLPKWEGEQDRDGDGANSIFYSSYSDESDGGGGVMYGQLTTASSDYWYYEDIRNINMLFEKLENNEAIDTETCTNLKAQASILRAWRYFCMVRVYGGVPMLLLPQKLTDDLLVSRNKTSECIDIIIKDLDYAYENLPWSWTGDDLGRATKAAALALKGRVLLYYASPQFNPDNLTDRWEVAYKVNKQAKEELEANGYGLYADYEKIWYDEMNREVIWGRRYQEPGATNKWNAATRPLSEAQNYTGANHPTLEMVESYPMITGVPITESTDYDPVLYWKNRDPRFNMTIAYNSCTWELSGKAGRKQWTYVGAELNNPTATGFYCRKAVETSYTSYYTERSSTDWIEIRHAEVLLNYAECAAMLGKTDEAYDVLKAIRARAGILAGDNGMYGLKPELSSGQMIDAIMLERKLELSFEGKRYWDLRRRRLFEAELNGKVRHGVLPKLNIPEEEFNKIKDTADFENDYATYFRDSLVILDKNFTIDFKDNYYFYAIPNKYLETNSKMEQTQGWSGGTFNPLD